MKRLISSPLLLISLFVGALIVVAARAADGLPRSAPEAQGVSSAGLLAFVEAADQQLGGMHSFMLVRHGQVVVEGWWTPYAPESIHELYSLSKSFTSTAVGFAVAEGRLSINDPVLKFFPDDAPAEPGPNLKAMRIRDLLMMSAGHQDETATAPDKISAKAFLAHPVPHKPGTHFKYNTPATFMLSAIVQKQTGQTVLDYLRPRLFEPLGMDHPVWNTNWQGISLGGYGLRVRTEDIARFGQLYLQKGMWHGQQILPAPWVEAATSRQTSNGSNPASDWDQGYGYQFWRCRHGAYRGDGAFGQYCLVLPEQDAVVAITSGVKDMQQVLNLVWDKLLPALQPRRLAADAASRKKLSAKMASLRLSLPEGNATSSQVEKILGRKFLFPANEQKLESLTLLRDPGGPGLRVVTQSNGVETRMDAGYQAWTKGRADFGAVPDQPMAASGAWLAEDTYVMKLCFHESPHCVTTKLRFEGDRVFYDSETNVSFGPPKRPQLVGQAH